LNLINDRLRIFTGMMKQIFKKILGLTGFELRYGVLKRQNSSCQIRYLNERSLAEGNELIAERLKQDHPFVVSRLGATELLLILNFLHFSKRKKVIWTDYHRDEIKRQSGVFPTDDSTLNGFSKIYLESIKAVDIMGVWYNEGEDFIIKKYCPGAEIIALRSLEPYFFEQPWSSLLVGKKVLVVHPFEDSILTQYSKRNLLFEDKRVLPDFELLTIKAVQSQVYNDTEFASWFDALEHMKLQISKKEFDIAIIGAGAYGLPLAAYVKQLGKKAIHMGGASQLLFGIKGKRWENRSEFRSLFNNHWKNPEDAERPMKYTKLEEGAYW